MSHSTIGCLYSIATPIGNRQDITMRALETLKHVEVIVCEDSRQLSQLLAFYDIPKPRVIVFHAQSKPHVIDGIIDLLRNGAQIGLVCDRGTPGWSDPGTLVVSAAIAAGISVVPIPGANAALTALQVSGFPLVDVQWKGFVPHKKGRMTFLQQVLNNPGVVVCYESPHRIVKFLQQLIEYGSDDRRLMVGRELTKLHEEFLRGSAAQILHELQARPKIQGEFVVVFGPQPFPHSHESQVYP